MDYRNLEWQGKIQVKKESPLCFKYAYTLKTQGAFYFMVAFFIIIVKQILLSTLLLFQNQV